MNNSSDFFNIMNNEYRTQLIHEGNYQTLQLPQELFLLTKDVSIRKEGEKLIIEPCYQKTLLEILVTLDDIDEEFPNVDEGLLPLDDIEL
jgi:antitoxin VapB